MQRNVRKIFSTRLVSFLWNVTFSWVAMAISTNTYFPIEQYKTSKERYIFNISRLKESLMYQALYCIAINRLRHSIQCWECLLICAAWATREHYSPNGIEHDKTYKSEEGVISLFIAEQGSSTEMYFQYMLHMCTTLISFYGYIYIISYHWSFRGTAITFCFTKDKENCIMLSLPWWNQLLVFVNNLTVIK